MKKKLILYGAAYPDVVKLVDAINQKSESWEIVGFLDDFCKNKSFMGIPIIGNKSFFKNNDFEKIYFINNIYSSTKIRKKISDLIERYECKLANLIHPAVDLKYAEIGKGIIINNLTYFGASVKIENHVAIRANCHIGHDTIIRQNSFLAPSACINGHSLIEEGVYVGSNSVIKERIRVGAWSTIGAGSVVTKNVEPSKIVAGNPASLLK
tara:strand:+ start:127 stop:756 length:630 start_codon:yes stop_codon:yes gene_type:complete